MKRYLLWSGGKDSSASIILCHENGIALDGILFSEVMFDISRNISGENPEHIKWVYNNAIPIVEKMGYRVIVLREKYDYLYNFNTIFRKSKLPERVGKKHGWLIGGHCWANRLKVNPIRTFLKNAGECQQIIGIAADEQARLKQNQRSVLLECGIAENDTYSICKKYGLLSPIYEYVDRGGCWFCPNAPIKEFARLAKAHPELYGELKRLSQDKNLCSKSFKYGLTFEEVDKKVELINNQMSIFDIIKNGLEVK